MMNKSSILKIALIFLMLLTVGMIAVADITFAIPAAPVLDYPWNGMNVAYYKEVI